MQELFQFTEAQLVEAFKIYNSEYLENKENFGEITSDEDTAKMQADKLLSILRNIA